VSRRCARASVAALIAATTVMLTVPQALAADPSGGDVTASQRAPYPGDPESEAGLVAAEDARLVEVRTVDSLARWDSLSLKAPYRLATGAAYTLALTPRREPYTIEDLLALAPQTFVRMPDGAFLLSENIVVQAGATLNLTNAGGLELRLASDANGFVSIVNYGGRLNITGTEGAPVKVTSFDRDQHTPDGTTNDGRAYVRSIGGQVLFQYAEFSHLGFWSGRTGGVSLTGTDRPNSGQLDDLGETMRVGKRADRERATEAAAGSADEPDESVETNGRSTLSQVLPAGPLPVPTVDVDTPQYSYVSAAINHTEIHDNAFGLFVSGANGLEIRDTSITHNMVDGLVMHRYVVNAVVESTSANLNGGDGIVLARATTGIVLSEITARGNQRNGVTMSGLPLANGPSATGISVGSYGNNSVANSSIADNGRYGVEVIGGINIGVLSNQVSGNDMGIVVREGAKDVSVVGNRVNRPERQGIAVRDGVTQGVVSGNIVDGGDTSVYVRDSETKIQANTLTGADMHAVSLVGSLGSTVVTDNTIGGRGASAIDTQRATDLDRDGWENELSGWQDTTPFLVTLKRFLQPLTLMWLILGTLLVVTAIRGVRKRHIKQHPYGDKAPVRGRVVALDGVDG
jgi:hypothetical protein